MIASLTGRLAAREADTLVVETDGGVGYAVTVPLGVHERLPAIGARLTLLTELVIREESWSLYGFDSPGEREIFRRLLGASGFGPKLALALLSALGPARTVRAVLSKDLAALATVPGIGRKKAERLVLELADRFADLPVPAGAVEPPSGALAAATALANLGYTLTVAEEAVRAAISTGADADDTAAVVRLALKHLAAGKGR